MASVVLGVEHTASQPHPHIFRRTPGKGPQTPGKGNGWHDYRGLWNAVRDRANGADTSHSASTMQRRRNTNCMETLAGPTARWQRDADEGIAARRVGKHGRTRLDHPEESRLSVQSTQDTNTGDRCVSHTWGKSLTAAARTCHQSRRVPQERDRIGVHPFLNRQGVRPHQRPPATLTHRAPATAGDSRRPEPGSLPERTKGPDCKSGAIASVVRIHHGPLPHHLTWRVCRFDSDLGKAAARFKSAARPDA